MKRLLQLLMAALLGLLLIAGGALLTQDAPMKTLEALAVKHADKLPLAWAGSKLFDSHCANCHDNPATHAPSREALSGFAMESVVMAMEFGKMQPMANHLSKRERFLIAHYLTGDGSSADDWVDNHRCDNDQRQGNTAHVANWGLGDNNRRYLSSEDAGIDRANVAGLELAWSLAFPRVTDMRSQPAIVGDTLYFGDKTGRLYALDRFSGCVRQHTRVLSGIRSAITAVQLADGRELLVFADSLASIFAVDPHSLETVWQQGARLFDTSVITGSISYHDGRLFVPVSSYEVAVSGSPTHLCCTSHGGLIALDAASGERLWEWHATENATDRGLNTAGAPVWGPSGASVWTTPAIDPQRRRIYFGTGENLTHPATDTSDAIIALDMATGEQAWRFQATEGDVWNAACLDGGANCPENPGGDFDFGASVIIADLPDGTQLLLAGQKSGEVFALNPDPATPDGEVLWRNRISLGTTNGGIHWGMALSGQTLVVPVSDPERDRPGYTPRPGLYGLDLTTGELKWQYRATRGCEFDEVNRPLIGLANNRSGHKFDLAAQYACSFHYGLSSAATATDQLAFAAGLDGVIRAHDIATGEVLWQARTAVPFSADNGIKGHGGAIDVGGQVIADGWLYVQSGYSMFGQLPGNVLLAYKVP